MIEWSIKSMFAGNSNIKSTAHELESMTRRQDAPLG